MSSKRWISRRLRVVRLLACVFALATAGMAPRLHALPPAAAVSGSLAETKWVEHRVIPGERLGEIAKHYHVKMADLLRWNDLPEHHARIRAGQTLRVHSSEDALVRKRKIYRVKAGDGWSRIAHKHHVSTVDLRRWNHKHDAELRVDDRVILWLEVEPPRKRRTEGTSSKAEDVVHAAVARKRVADRRPAPSKDAEDVVEAPRATVPTPTATHDDAYPIVDVSPRSHSLGRPGRGRIGHPIQLPKNDALYRLRDPSHSYASSHTIMVLQKSIARFRRETGYAGEVVFNDLSRRGGGRLRPHRSHQSGRDADIRLPLVPGTERDNGTGDIDWDATWALMSSMIDTGQVRYIFLSRHRQRSLRRAAQRAGASEEQLSKWLQFPGYERTAVIRHSPGHDQHFHVRIACGPEEDRCRE